MTKRNIPPNSEEEILLQLLRVACQCPPGHLFREEKLSQILRIVVQSPQLFRDPASGYAGALHQALKYFANHLDQARVEANGNPQQRTLIDWINTRIRQYLTVQSLENALAHPDAETRFINPVIGRCSPDELRRWSLLEMIQGWAIADSSGELCKTHFCNCPGCSCQVLILRRLSLKTSWVDLAAECATSLSALGCFYQQDCLPLLRELSRSQGYVMASP